MTVAIVVYKGLIPVVGRILTEKLAVDSTVVHKKFGKGTVVKINKNEKFIYVRFALGEKKFIFPDAFFRGFIEVEY